MNTIVFFNLCKKQRNELRSGHTTVVRCSLHCSVSEEPLMGLPTSFCRGFHYIATLTMNHIVATMAYDQIVTTFALDTILQQ
jgi:hypothetical protein